MGVCVSAFLSSARRPARIDLDAVRDTLLYIESDVAQSSELDRVAKAIREALVEIERIDTQAEPRNGSAAITGARFLPVRL